MKSYRSTRKSEKKEGYPSFFVRLMPERKENMNEIITKVSLIKLSETIRAKGCDNVSESLESVLLNLGYLATEVVDFGDKKRYIPLALKEVLLKLLYPESSIICKSTHSEDYSYWESNATVFLNDTDKVSGEGRFAYSLTQYCTDNNISPEEGKCSIGNYVRGSAKTRAIQSALPFLNLYCDEDMLPNETGRPQGELPKPVPQEEKKKKAATLQKEKASPVKEEATTEENPISVPAETEIESFINSIPHEEPCAKNVAKEALTASATTESTTDTSVTLDEAFALIADVGDCKGNSLKTIYEKCPKNIIWMYNRGNSAHKDALKVIIDSDTDLKAFIK